MLNAFNGNLKKIGGFVALATGLFHMYTAVFGVFDAYTQRSVHLALMLAIIYLTVPMVKNKDKYNWVMQGIDVLLLAAAIIIAVYQLQQGTELIFRSGFPNPVDMFMGFALIILVLEGARRTIGLPLTIVCLVFLLYTFYGRHMPSALSHPGFSLKEIINVQFMGTQGIYTTPIGVMSTYVVIFVIFGAVLSISGASVFFNRLAKALVGHFTGGPAKVAVFASAFMGTVSGSVVANVVTTGSFTIPMMKELGYDDAFAGAVEAAASTGGQIMPPIMGAAAFMMADFLGIPYIKVAFAALLPAILYFVSIGFSVHLEALKHKLPTLARKDCPKIGEVLKEGGALLIPLFVLIAVLVAGYTPMRAGLAGVFSLFLVVFAMNIVKNGFVKGSLFAIKSLIEGIKSGARGCIAVTSATAAAGIIIGTVSQSGLGLRLTSLILKVSGGSLIITLILIGIACLIMGMGMPTAGAYIVVVTLGVPALVAFGIPPLAAHMFVFYMAIISAVTPPVAIGAYAAAGVSGASPWKTGITAFRLDLAGFLIPFVIVFAPALILEGSAAEAALVFSSSLLGLFFLAVSFVGYFLVRVNTLWRILSFLGGILLVIPGAWSDIIGLCFFIVFLLQQRRSKKTLLALE